MKKILRTMAILLSLFLLVGTASAANYTDPVITGIDTYPMVHEPVQLSIGLTNNSYVSDYEDNAYTKMIEEVTGLDLVLEIFPEVDASTKLMLMINGGSELPDILTFGVTDPTMRNQAAEAGALYSLDGFFDRETGIADTFYTACERYGLDPNVYLALSRSADGHIYCVSKWEGFLPNMYNYRAWINQDWLDALNLEAPTTIDELTDVLKAFRDGDPNGNGMKDEVPMTGADASSMTSNSNCFTWLQNLFIFRDKTGNLFLPLSDTNGAFDVSYDKEEYREFLKYVNMLVAEDLLDEAAFTQTTSEMRQQLQADTQTIGMMFGSANGFGGNIPSWQPLEQPAGYYGTRIVSVDSPAPSASIVITADCEHPEVAFTFATMDFGLAQGEYFWIYSGRYGEKDVDWRYAEPGEESVFKEIGMLPGIKVLNITWGTVSNKHWQWAEMPKLSNGNNMSIEVFDGNEAYGERLHARSVEMNMQYAPEVKDVIGSILYTQEERDEWDGIRSTLRSYIIESSSLFAVGQLDPNSDADWENYLNELNVMNYKGLIAMDEAAYKRTFGLD